jgi:hypothetical protein
MTRNGYPYPFCSGSEQWRIKTTIQLAVAEVDNSCAVIIDMNEDVDSEGKNNLIQMLLNANKINIAALVCMAFSKKEKMPDLSDMGGRTYWVEDGILN